jgi:hypothetical protein
MGAAMSNHQDTENEAKWADAVESMKRVGFADLRQSLDADLCRALRAQLADERAVKGEIFVTEEAFNANPVIPGQNPRPGRNFLERPDLEFIEEEPGMTSFLEAVLGDGYELLVKKVVVSLPYSWVPTWIHERIAENGFRNLNPYVRDELKDVTYFLGQPWHQDLIDYKGRPCDFITVYAYLDEVTADCSPLMVIPGSHILGADMWPHAIERLDPTSKRWRYTTAEGLSAELEHTELTGIPGDVYAWHGCLLHGTLPSRNDKPRLSLRYLLGTAQGAGRTLLDEVNTAVEGSLQLDTTRKYVGDERVKDSLSVDFPEAL